MTISLDDLATFLGDNGLTNVQLNRMPPGPDQVVTATEVGGSPPILDGAFEASHVQIRCRDDKDVDAETAAKAVHALFSANEGSFQMGGTYVLTIMPISGPPLYFGQDVSNRTIYSATYEFTCPV